MKKFIKWFLFWLVVCGGLALAICYMVIPQQTKSAIDIVIGYLNTPLGIVGGTTITLGMVVYIVVYNLLKLNRDKAKQDFEECKQQLEEKKKELDKKLEEVKELLGQFETSTNDKINKLFEFCVNNKEMLALIPNKKVQERLEQLYGKDQERTND